MAKFFRTHSFMYRFWYNFQWMIKLYIIFCLNFLNFLNLFLLTFLWTTFCHCFLEKKPYLLICPLVCLVYSVIVYCHSRYNCGFSNPDITPEVKVKKFLWPSFFRFLIGLGPLRAAQARDQLKTWKNKVTKTSLL